MSIPVEQFVTPKVRGWANSAVVLGSIYALMCLPRFFTFNENVHVEGFVRAAISLGIASGSFLIAIGFVVGGVLTARGSVNGRDVLASVGIAGAVISVLDGGWDWFLFRQPSIAHRMSQMSAAAPSMSTSAIDILLMALPISFLVFAGIQMCYCLTVHKVMAAE